MIPNQVLLGVVVLLSIHPAFGEDSSNLVAGAAISTAVVGGYAIAVGIEGVNSAKHDLWVNQLTQDVVRSKALRPFLEVRYDAQYMPGLSEDAQVSAFQRASARAKEAEEILKGTRISSSISSSSMTGAEIKMLRDTDERLSVLNVEGSEIHKRLGRAKVLRGGGIVIMGASMAVAAEAIYEGMKNKGNVTEAGDTGAGGGTASGQAR